MRNSENSRKELLKLKDLDNLIKCGICYEYLKTTLITPCSHNYCSYCIRQSLSYKNQCPTCFEDINESQLRNNRIVDEFISIFICIKEKLHRYLSNLPNLKANYESTEENHEQIRHNKEVIKESAVKLSTPNSSSNESSRHESTPTKSMPSTSKREVLIPSMFSPRKQKSLNINEVKVACPVCSVEIPEKNINVHLDACLKRSHEKGNVPQSDKRKLLPKLVYHLLPEKELRKKLNDLGLSTVGDRTTLINRHKRYTILYNSECDSLKPRPVLEIIKQIKKEEEEEKKLAPQVVKKLNVDRKADPQVNEEAQRQYLIQNKSSFQKLIEEARRSKDVKRNVSSPKENESIITIDESSDTSENEFKIKYSAKRKIISSDSESEDEHNIDGIEEVSQIVIQNVKNLPTNLLEERRGNNYSPNVSNKENELIECKTINLKSEQRNAYEDSTDEMETDDDLAENIGHKVLKYNGRRKSPKDDSNSLTSVTSPVLITKSRVNRTPKSGANQIPFCKRDLTSDLKSPRALAPLSSPGIAAGQGPEEDVIESDSSSNHSTSLMVYTGPDCGNSLDSGSPMKTPNKINHQIDTITPIAKVNFDMGIDDILQNSEEFVSLPTRRQSTRKKETKKSLREPNTKGRVRRKRVRIDDL